MDDRTEVTDVPDENRYEIRLDGDLAGLAAYQRRPGEVVFTHTEIDPAFEGHGLGSTLARAALDDARSRGESVVPRCQFIRAFIDRHPDYADLVAEH